MHACIHITLVHELSYYGIIAALQTLIVLVHWYIGGGASNHRRCRPPQELHCCRRRFIHGRQGIDNLPRFFQMRGNGANFGMPDF